ncbi:MAG: VacJ family lipoprotein [Pseudomonadota bacterium]
MSKKILTFIIFIIALQPYSSWSKAPTKKQKDTIATRYQTIDEEAEYAAFELQTSEEIYDPLEKMNRKVFIFNDYFDRYFFEYVAKFYRKGVPQGARMSIRNFLLNLSLPVSAVNSLLQGNVDNTLSTFSNFLINSTVGLGGLFDVAGEKGIKYRVEDFGQTLGHYRTGSGAYLVLPFLGPSSTRDLGGLLVDKSVNPFEFNLLEVGGREDLISSNTRLALAGAAGVDKRESLIDVIDSIKADSFDPYATFRSAYLQKRQTDIKF